MGDLQKYNFDTGMWERTVPDPVEQAERIIKTSFHYADGGVIPRGTKFFVCSICFSYHRSKTEVRQCAEGCFQKRRENGHWDEPDDEGKEPWIR